MVVAGEERHDVDVGEAALGEAVVVVVEPVVGKMQACLVRRSWADAAGLMAVAAHMEIAAASGRIGNTFAAPSAACHILVGHGHRAEETELKQASWTVVFDSLRWVDKAGD